VVGEPPPSHPPTTDTLAVPGARLYYEVRGTGPALLLIPTGNGDAAQYWPLANALADRYTVITYDRRGFSRSVLDGPVPEGQRVQTDASDAHRLLDHLADGPAHAFGSSSGAIVALALLERHPDTLRTLVSHEPPLASVLPDSAQWLQFYHDLYGVYRNSGAKAARDVFRDRMGMSGPTRPPAEAELPPDELAEMVARVRHNQPFWFEYELRSYPAFQPDIAALSAASDRLVLAGSSTTREQFPYRPNVVLAERIGTAIVHFPGSHIGYSTHPAEFADRLSDVLAA
jgi:pimeloyl-ACP methyl ester carboxylesterase